MREMFDRCRVFSLSCWPLGLIDLWCTDAEKSAGYGGSDLRTVEGCYGIQGRGIPHLGSLAVDQRCSGEGRGGPFLREPVAAAFVPARVPATTTRSLVACCGSELTSFPIKAYDSDRVLNRRVRIWNGLHSTRTPPSLLIPSRAGIGSGRDWASSTDSGTRCVYVLPGVAGQGYGGAAVPSERDRHASAEVLPVSRRNVLK